MGALFDNEDLYESTNGMLHARPLKTQPIFRLAAHVLVTNGGGRILMVKPVWSGRWELPGGIIDPIGGSDAINEACALACGYRIMVRRGQSVLFTTERKRHHPIDQTFCRQMVLVYEGCVMTHQYDAALHQLGETSEVAWRYPSQLRRRDCHPAFWPFLRTVVLNGKKRAA